MKSQQYLRCFATSRSLHALMGVLSCAALLAALFFQYYDHLEPCMLCISQRILFLGVAIISFIAVVHNSAKKCWHYLYSSLLLFFSIAGIAFAARHLWITYLPITDRPACLPNVGTIFAFYEWAEILPLFFVGTGDCGDVAWHLMGLSMPAWSLLIFTILFLLAMVGLKKQKGG